MRTLFEANQRLSIKDGKPFNDEVKGMYQRLVEKLIYISLLPDLILSI